MRVRRGPRPGSDVAADHALRGGQMTLPVTSAIATGMGKRRA